MISQLIYSERVVNRRQPPHRPSTAAAFARCAATEVFYLFICLLIAHRLRRSSTSSSVAAIAGEGPCNEKGDLLNGGDTSKKSGNDNRVVESGRVASMHYERSPGQLEQRRSIQFSEPEVVNRTYESVDEVATKVSFYKQPVTAELPPTPGTGPPHVMTASGMGIGIRPSHLGMENVADPPDQQQRESVDEYVVMAPSTLRLIAFPPYASECASV